jgi:hypothetical protein
VWQVNLVCRCSLILALAFAGSSAIATAQVNNFHSDEYKYKLSFPAGWFKNSFAPSKSLFSIINFRKPAHAVFLPPRGAEIGVTPIEARQGPTDPRSSARREVPHTLEEWIAINTRNEQVEVKRNLTVGGRLPVVEVKMTGADRLVALEWYFSLRGRLFNASLLCWADNPDFERLRQVLQQVVLTLSVE